MKYIYTFSLMFISLSIFSQIKFTPAANGKTGDFHSGVAVGVADLNGDGMDDIIRFSGGDELEIEYQTSDCNKFISHEATFDLDDVWNVAVGDVNNDGYNDIMSSGFTDNVTLLVYQPGIGEYDEIKIPNTNFFAQAANFADIDNDGWLDAFVCNDNGTSYILMNDGAGNLTTTQDVIDMNTVPTSDNSGNYGSLWGDFDSDGDVDLYIAKCRQGVNDPTDPRRINSFFLNDGNNNYTDQADSFGLAIGWQSWTADFADYDLDGDLDCFITNHDAPSQLLENRGDSTFVDVTATSNIDIFGTPVQGVFRDFDNDGWVDLLVTGSQHSLWKNNGDGSFEEIDDAFTNSQMMSFSVGDLNHDGFLDVYGGYGQIFNGTSNRDDILFYNNGNNNNHINFQLEGTTSNRNAVGARIELYSDLGMQIREVRAGESYGISLSHDLHFGIGTASEIDSAIIKWPSGLIEVLHDLEINKTHSVKEGGCVTERFKFNQSCVELCTGDSATLVAPTGFGSYLWSNGMTGESINISTPGMYWVEMQENDSTCSVRSNSVNVDFSIDGQETELSANRQLSLCDGETIQLTAPNSAQYLWSTGETSQIISVQEGGVYSATLMGTCSVWQSDSLEVNFFKANLPEVENDTIFGAGQASLSGSGENVSWYATLFDALPIFEGNTFVTPEISQTTSYFASNKLILEDSNAPVGPTEHSGNAMYGGNMFNGSLIFDVLEPLIIDTVTVFTDFPGPRIFQIRLQNGTLAFESDTLQIDSGQTEIYINARIDEPGQYVFSTDQQFNNETFGVNSPRLVRSDGGLSYPYFIQDVVSINRSGFGVDFYYYFYDWKVRRQGIVCESERVEALAVVELDTKTKNSKEAKFNIYPNPTNHRAVISSDELIGQQVHIELINIQGALLFESTINSFSGTHEMNFDGFGTGMYLIKLETNDSVGFQKLMVQKD